MGSPFASEAFTRVLKAADIAISMDDKVAWRNNVFVERFWRSVKYEKVYLNTHESMAEAKQRIGDWIQFYNQARKHQILKCTPDQMYQDNQPPKMAA